MSYADRVNRTQVDAKLLEAVLARLAEQPAEARPFFEARTFGIFALLSERGWRGKRLGTLAIAIEFRLAALSRLLNAEGGRGFTSHGDATGAALLHADLVRCAAEEPLIDQDDQPTFAIESFERRLLTITAVALTLSVKQPVQQIQ